MRPQEALRHFEEHLCKHCCEWDKSLRHCDTCPTDTAKKAMEKQIPKMPILENTKGIFGIDMWHCPVCKDEIISDWNRDIANPYCHHCGQAIDWSDEDE